VIGMIREAPEVRLTPEERAVLGARLRAPRSEQRQVFRARVVLLAAALACAAGLIAAWYWHRSSQVPICRLRGRANRA
jgi:fatty acid desaturase